MARQLKPIEHRRTERMEFRLSPNEIHELVMRAVKARMTTSDYIRKSALGQSACSEKSSLNENLLISQLDELHTIGNVLGQLVRSGKYANSPEQTQLLTETLENIKTLSRQLIVKLSA